jgi:hypothetical protein
VIAQGLFKKAGQQGRSERNGEAYSVRYVEPLSETRTKLAAFFNSPILPRSVIRGCDTLHRRRSLHR